MAVAVAVDGLRKSYGTVEAVKGVTFSIEEGEVFALLGPNGAGKTTIVEILEGYRKRSAGTVEVLGMDPEKSSRRLKERIGIVLQESTTEPYLTVEEVLRQRTYWYPNPSNVDDVIALVGLEEKRRARLRTLSGGQQRRLDLALGLIGNPDLIFLDEPTTGFDPSARRASWVIIRNLCSLGKTVLLTTHYMDEAQHLANRVAVISGGVFVAEGTPDSLGGRNQAAVHIRFSLPDGISLHDLPIPARPDAAAGDVVIETQEPTAALARLTGWAVERRLELPGLSVTRPTLEDVYLELAGDPTDGAAADTTKATATTKATGTTKVTDATKAAS
ncbi:MAG: type transport system ATP-binding protein [Acidimicrobiaceae bacterium]|nr:type transport system ATP-binding protein [Acidimicrobiaceae bacterium]